jgi:hypothetical protein
MRAVLVVLLLGLTFTSSAAAKEGRSVVVLGPNGRTLVEPFAPFDKVLEEFPSRPPLELPQGGYVWVYPLMAAGIPMRPGRWYPRSGLLCSGWRSGVEAGCVSAPRLRGWLGSGVYTGLFTGRPTVLARLRRRGTSLPPDGNVAVALELALAQPGAAGARPHACVEFDARWSGPRAAGEPRSFCVSAAGGAYAGGKVYPLGGPTARFVTTWQS